jgi:hypothetical protein
MKIRIGNQAQGICWYFFTTVRLSAKFPLQSHNEFNYSGYIINSLNENERLWGPAIVYREEEGC